MPWRRIPLVVIGFLLTFPAWAGSSANSAPITSVAMEQYECFWGTCPNYVVWIQNDGSANYIGLAAARKHGPVQLHVTRSGYDKIVSAIEAMHYFSMGPEYTSKGEGCKEMMSDQSTVTFYVTRGGNTKEVTLYYGCKLPGVSDKLSALALLIDKEVGDEPLLGRGEHNK